MEQALTMKQLRRLEQRERTRLKNEPPVLTLGEEIFNAVSHGLGTLLAVAGMVLLLGFMAFVTFSDVTRLFM